MIEEKSTQENIVNGELRCDTGLWFPARMQFIPVPGEAVRE